MPNSKLDLINEAENAAHGVCLELDYLSKMLKKIDDACPGMDMAYLCQSIDKAHSIVSFNQRNLRNEYKALEAQEHDDDEYLEQAA